MPNFEYKTHTNMESLKKYGFDLKKEQLDKIQAQTRDYSDVELQQGVQKNLKIFSNLERDAEEYSDFFSTVHSSLRADKEDSYSDLKNATKNIKERSQKRHKHHNDKMNTYSAKIQDGLKTIQYFQMRESEGTKTDITTKVNLALIKVDVAQDMYKYQMHYIKNFGHKDTKEAKDIAAVHLASLIKQNDILQALQDKYGKELENNEEFQKKFRAVKAELAEQKKETDKIDLISYKETMAREDRIHKERLSDIKKNMDMNKFRGEVTEDYNKHILDENAYIIRESLRASYEMAKYYEKWCQQESYSDEQGNKHTFLVKGTGDRFEQTGMLKLVRFDKEGKVIKEDEKIDEENKKILRAYFTGDYEKAKPGLKLAMLRSINCKNNMFKNTKETYTDADYEKMKSQFSAKNIKDKYLKIAYESRLSTCFSNLISADKTKGKPGDGLGKKFLMELGMKEEKDWHFFEHLLGTSDFLFMGFYTGSLDEYGMNAGGNFLEREIQGENGKRVKIGFSEEDERLDAINCVDIQRKDTLVDEMSKLNQEAKTNGFMKCRMDMMKQGREDLTIKDVMQMYNDHIEDFKKSSLYTPPKKNK